MATGISIMATLREMGLSPRAAKFCLQQGQVYINGRQLGAEEHVIGKAEQGGFLTVVGRMRRVGTPIAELVEALEEEHINDDDAPPHDGTCDCDDCDAWWSR